MEKKKLLLAITLPLIAKMLFTPAYAIDMNVALGKISTSNTVVDSIQLVTDGNKSTNSFAKGAGGLQWITVDLASRHSIDQVNLVHYFSDGRKYHDVIVQLSNDVTFSTGVTTVFNNDTANVAGQGAGTDKEYAEASTGKLLRFPAVTARYIRTSLNGSNVDKSNSWVEVEVNSSNSSGMSAFNLVPWPQTVTPSSGNTAITSLSRIIATSASLVPVANVVAQEIHVLTGITPPVIQQSSGLNGDIVLKLNAALTGTYQSRTTIANTITVEGHDSTAVAMGSANISQLISSTGVLPNVYIEDNTPTQYAELMLDVARAYNSIQVLKRCIILCRLYKIPFFRLHLTDDALWMFQSLTYPELGKGNGKGDTTYTQVQLKDLVQFAKVRGISVIPEIECLGHSTAMRRDRPDLFGTPTGTILQANNVASDTFYIAITNIMKEVAQVFYTSPYIHIGEDEAGMSTVLSYAPAQTYLKAHKITTTDQLWVDHLSHMDTIVKSVGKKLCLWEGFDKIAGALLSPKSDYLISEYAGLFFSPLNVKAAGFSMINVPWIPSVYSSQADNYAWNMWLVGSNGRKPNQLPIGDPSVIGGSMVLWAVPGDVVINLLRAPTPARQERIYNNVANKTFADFQTRFNNTDVVLQKLFTTFISNPVPAAYLSAGNTKSFGVQPLDSGATAPFDIQILNNGDADLLINSVAITTHNGDTYSQFAIVYDSGEQVIKPGKTRTVSIAYDPFPGLLNPNSAYFTVKTNDPVHPTLQTWMIGKY